MTNFVPQIGNVNIPQMNSGFVSPFGTGSMEAVDATQKGSFKDVMSGLTKNLNESVSAPDQLLKDSVAGNGVDIHDVILAMNKAEIGVNIATQLTTKIVQSYEKIMAIQV